MSPRVRHERVISYKAGAGDRAAYPVTGSDLCLMEPARAVQPGPGYRVGGFQRGNGVCTTGLIQRFEEARPHLRAVAYRHARVG